MPDRKLPTRHNSRLSIIEDETTRQEYIEKRKLGRTEIPKVVGQVGLTNATSDASLGELDYAFVRCPLPKDLKGSGIHNEKVNGTKGHYYMMRRSHDGYISATGMFKVAFPWASLAEEDAERTYLKSLPSADPNEVANNIWIPVEEALELADEYKMRPWIMVLLDPTPMGSSGTHATELRQPPAYKPQTKAARAKAAKAEANANDTSSQAPPASARKRVTRSASPSKDAPAATPRKIATPKRAKRGRPPGTASKLASTEELDETVSDTIKLNDDTDAESSASKVIHQSIENANGTLASVKSRVERISSVDAQAILDRANAALKEATDLSNNRTVGRKRKARDVELEDEEIDGLGSDKEVAAAVAKADHPPAPKRVKVTELELRKEKIMRRAGMGIAASLAFGALVPVIGAFFQSM